MRGLIHIGIRVFWMSLLLTPVLCSRNHGERSVKGHPGEPQQSRRKAREIKDSDEDSDKSSPRTGTDHALAIVRGKSAKIGTNPWMAALSYTDDEDREPYCGGSLISNRYVLTAGHCSFRDEYYPCWCCLRCKRERKVEASEMIVTLGMVNWHHREETARDFDVQEIILHHGYFGPADDDIALLRLHTEVTFGTHIDTISLPPFPAEYTGKMARFTGWGLLEHKGKKPDKLQSMDVRIVD